MSDSDILHAHSDRFKDRHIACRPDAVDLFCVGTPLGLFGFIEVGVGVEVV